MPLIDLMLYICSLKVCKTAYPFHSNERRLTTATIRKYHLFHHIELKKNWKLFENLTLNFLPELSMDVLII